jgi:hypothetical protein
VPTATVCSSTFVALGEAESRNLGLPDLPLTVVPHPIGNLADDRARDLGQSAVPGVVESLTTGAPRSGQVIRGARLDMHQPVRLAADFSGPVDVLEATEIFSGRGWGDGLPIVPPTRERVDRVLDVLGRDPNEELGPVPPRWGVATVELVVVNAIMAGCPSQLVRVVLAAVEAVLKPAYNLYSIQATTGSVGPSIIVSGPLADELGISGGAGCLGPGHRANLAVGRALRMVLANIGGATPGALDRATLGQPGKIALCFSENQADNPWPPLHVELGYEPEQSVVIIDSIMGTTDIMDHTSNVAEDLLHMLSGCVGGSAFNHTQTGGHSVLVLCPEHAGLLAQAGLSRADVARELSKRASIEVGAFTGRALENVVRVRRARHFGPGVTRIPVFDGPEFIRIVVAGGAGPHSTFLPSFGEVTVPQVVPIR